MSEDLAPLRALGERWVTLYNESHEQLVEMYVEDLEARAMGLPVVIRGRDHLRQASGNVLKIAPHRRARAEHIHVTPDTVVIEAVLTDADMGGDWQSPFCAVLTVRDGMIVSERTYLDVTRWPGLSPRPLAP